MKFKKITLTGVTGVAALVYLLLNIAEKAERFIAKASSPENYNVEKYIPKDYITKEAIKK